jgi:catechol 2,3-dioxygenase-like lactoylglutathione lyase family enzyme
MKLRWSHAVLYVRDLEGMIDFYGNVLGFEVSDRGPMDPNMPGLELAFLTQVGTDHHQLAFAPVRGDGPSTTLDHIAFRVESLADVKELVDKLKDDGRAGDLAAVTHGNAWSVYFKDPEENTIEVFCDSPFHVKQPQIKPWDFDMSPDELLQYTKEQFADEPEFGPIDRFYEKQRERFED